MTCSPRPLPVAADAHGRLDLGRARRRRELAARGYSSLAIAYLRTRAERLWPHLLALLARA